MIIDKTGNYIPLPTHIHNIDNVVITMATNSNNISIVNSSTYTRPSHSDGLIAGLVTSYSIVVLMAVTSNAFILITILRRLVPRNAVNIFLASLAVSDVLMVLLSLFDCVAFVTGSWVVGEWTCKMQSFLIEVCFTASTLTLVAVSCERYLLICYPHMKKRTIKAIYTIVSFVWLAALVFCSPLLHGYVVYEDVDLEENTLELVCANKGWPRKHQRLFYFIYSFFVYLLPLIIMAFAHWRISRSVKDNTRRPQSSLSSQGKPEKKASICYTIREESSGGSSDVTAESNEFKKKASGVQKAIIGSVNTLRKKMGRAERDINRREKRIKAVRVLFVVTVTFFLLWTPFIFLRLLLLSGIAIDDYAYKFSEIVIFSSTAVNGFIYAFMSPPFRKAFAGIASCQGRREIFSRDSGPSMSNSEDNKISNRFSMSRGSTFSGFSYGSSETRN